MKSVELPSGVTKQIKTKPTEMPAPTKRGAVELRAVGALPPAGPVTIRRVSADEARNWRPAAKPLTLTQISRRLARERSTID
jgi:hypothetical protein